MTNGIVDEKERADGLIDTVYHTSDSPFFDRACGTLRGAIAIDFTTDTFTRKRKSMCHTLLRCKISLSAVATAISSRGTLGGRKSFHRGLAHFILLTWVFGVTIFARGAATGGQAGAAGGDPWLRSLDLSIPESHDKRIGVYDVLKGVENTPSDNLLFAVARDVLATYELTKPFLEEVVRVHQLLRTHHRDHRKRSADSAYSRADTSNGGTAAQTAEAPVGKKRQKRHAGSNQVDGVAPGPGASAAVSSSSNVADSLVGPSAAEGLRAAAASEEDPFERAKQQPPQRTQHGLRFPATAVQNRDKEAARALPADGGGGWWSTKKTKRSDGKIGKKEGLLPFEETVAPRGPHTRRKHYREISRAQLGEYGKTEEQPQNQQQYLPHPESGGTEEQRSSTSNMQTTS